MNYSKQDKAPHFKSKPQKPAFKGKNSDNKRREFKPPKKITEKYLHNSGLAYLQRFTASSMHFKTVMTRKIDKSCRHHVEQNRDDCLKMLNNVTEKFFELGLLDDNAYLKGMITSFRRRGLSSRQIDMKLRQKGYDGERILEALRIHDLDEYNTEYTGDFYAALTFARKKKIGPYDEIARYEFDKALSMMGRAGYNFETSKKIIEMSKEELEEYEAII
ncbi:MAG: RecX family transcriptional regulator [Pseudomonadota bacterium]